MNDFLTIPNRAQTNFLMSDSNRTQMHFLMVEKLTLKKNLFVPKISELGRSVKQLAHPSAKLNPKDQKIIK